MFFTISLIFSSVHMTFIQRRNNVAATSCIDIELTLSQRCVPAGFGSLDFFTSEKIYYYLKRCWCDGVRVVVVLFELFLITKLKKKKKKKKKKT